MAKSLWLLGNLDPMEVGQIGEYLGSWDADTWRL